MSICRKSVGTGKSEQTGELTIIDNATASAERSEGGREKQQRTAGRGGGKLLLGVGLGIKDSAVSVLLWLCEWRGAKART